jgi:hypothetical protein
MMPMIFRRVGSLDLLGSLLLLLALDGSTLVLDALLSPLAGGLGLRTLGVHLLLELGLAGGLSLGLVNLQRLLDLILNDRVMTLIVAGQDVVT